MVHIPKCLWLLLNGRITNIFLGGFLYFSTFIQLNVCICIHTGLFLIYNSEIQKMLSKMDIFNEVSKNWFSNKHLVWTGMSLYVVYNYEPFYSLYLSHVLWTHFCFTADGLCPRIPGGYTIFSLCAILTPKIFLILKHLSSMVSNKKLWIIF